MCHMTALHMVDATNLNMLLYSCFCGLHNQESMATEYNVLGNQNTVEYVVFPIIQLQYHLIMIKRDKRLYNFDHVHLYLL